VGCARRRLDHSGLRTTSPCSKRSTQRPGPPPGRFSSPTPPHQPPLHLEPDPCQGALRFPDILFRSFYSYFSLNGGCRRELCAGNQAIAGRGLPGGDGSTPAHPYPGLLYFDQAEAVELAESSRSCATRAPAAPAACTRLWRWPVRTSGHARASTARWRIPGD
jgi:hypothetical protein